MASFKGINGAPAFSPDGRRLALTLSKAGNPEIYVMDLGSKALTQVTRHYGIDTESVWTAGRPDPALHLGPRRQAAGLLRSSAGGGEPTRVSFQGESNARATVSFDGKKIAHGAGLRATSTGSRSSIAASAAAAAGRRCRPGNLDESPSFAPNASMLLYATKEGRRGVLYAVSADGRVRLRIVSTDMATFASLPGRPFRQR